jgi:UDP-glucose 4-epimerase
MKIMVTGGAGYIGSHAVRFLLDQGHFVVVLDNLSHGHLAAVDPRAFFIHGDTGYQSQLVQIFQTHNIEAVIHFAANIEVAESVADPGKYYENNVACTVQLLKAMVLGGVNKLVFSSTAAVYGNPESCPIKEDQKCQPINPYGRSKWMSEMIIQDFCTAHNLGYAILRYFNVAGAWPGGIMGEDHHPETHLIPRILASARNPNEILKIFGTDYPTPDGTCVRDYIHVVDLVRAHALALLKIQPGTGHIFNLGSEAGFSVRQVIAASEKVTLQKLKVHEEPRRPGDPATLVASSQKTREMLGWERQYPQLEDIISHAWLWHSKHPTGYQSDHKTLIDLQMRS